MLKLNFSFRNLFNLPYAEKSYLIDIKENRGILHNLNGKIYSLIISHLLKILLTEVEALGATK